FAPGLSLSGTVTVAVGLAQAAIRSPSDTSVDVLTMPSSSPSLAQLPRGSIGGVAELDAGRGQAVAHAVGERPLLGGPQLHAESDETVDHRGEKLARIP